MPDSEELPWKMLVTMGRYCAGLMHLIMELRLSTDMLLDVHTAPSSV